VYARDPARSFTWRTLHRYPRLIPLARAMVPKRSRTVPPNDQPVG